jgi:DNA-binding transcriptional ArsR family regulator
MEKSDALGALGALAQETRLDIFRFLVEVGPAGLPAGQIGERFALPWATLSFHLSQMKQSGLVTYRRDGRSLIYAADYEQMNALLAYLTENCCGGRPDACAPACTPTARKSKGASHEASARPRRGT